MPSPEEKPKRLFRSETDRVIGGVCGGIGEYFGIDPTIIRIIFVILAFSGGSGIFIYLILWLIIPSASQRTATATEQTIRSNAKEVGERAKSLGDELVYHANRERWERVFGVVILTLGIIMLLSNFELVNVFLVKLWPAALIIIGGIILARGGSK